MNFIKKLFWNKLQNNQKEMHDEDKNNNLSNGNYIGQPENSYEAHEPAHTKVDLGKFDEFASGQTEVLEVNYTNSRNIILTASGLPSIVDNEDLLPISIGLTSNELELCSHENKSDLDCKKSAVDINKYEPSNDASVGLDSNTITDLGITDEINSKGDVVMEEEVKDITFCDPEASSESCLTEDINCVSCNNNNGDNDINNNIFKETANAPKYTVLTNVVRSAVKVEQDFATYNYNFKTKNMACDDKKHVINDCKETNDSNLTHNEMIKLEVFDEDQISSFKILKPNKTTVTAQCERLNGEANANNFIETISISSTDDDAENAIFSISSNDSRIEDGEDSDYCSGYNSSDFEFITETEAKKAGITFKENKATLKRVEIIKDFDSDSDKPEKLKDTPPGSSNRHIFRAPSRNFIEINDDYREYHQIPEGDAFLHLFQGIYAPTVPRSMYFMENKSIRSSQPVKGLDELGFDIQMLSRRHGMEIEANEELRREEKESVKRILSVYPAENRKRRRC